MGNQPSSPTPAPPTQSPPSIPPLPPPCDLKCQKDKQLVLLKQNLDSANKQTDPEGYEKARIAYFTLLNGPGWLAQEKQRIAKQEVEPTTATYRQRYEALKGEQQSQKMFETLANGLKAQSAADEASNQYLDKELMKEKDRTRTLERLNQLSSTGPVASPAWISWIVDAILVALGLFVAYKGYMRFFPGTTVADVVPDLSSTV